MGSLGMNLNTGMWLRRSTGEKGNIFHFIQEGARVNSYEAFKIASSFVSTNNQQKEQGIPKDATKKTDAWIPAYDKIKDAKSFDAQQDLKNMLKFNNLETTYDYKNSEGELIGHVVRFISKKDGSKQTMPVTYCYEPQTKQYSWHLKGFTDQGFKPIFGIEKLKGSDKPVLIVEGEKAAIAASKMLPEYDVVSWLGGSNVADKPNWSQLKSKKVIIWPDNDQAGFKAATIIKEQLNKANGQLGFVKIINPQSLKFDGTIHKNILPEKWDLADKLPDGMSIANVKEAIANVAMRNPVQQQSQEQKLATSVKIQDDTTKPLSEQSTPTVPNKIETTSTVDKEENHKYSYAMKKQVIEQMKASEVCSISSGDEVAKKTMEYCGERSTGQALWYLCRPKGRVQT